ncbi:hypothetical protein [Candidatus Nitrosocosmicus arcticus]|uniref:Uncharacterized protein n=1 Tax=Candidatus Nitrosocosmicus arcticus TaxID=2035267 RepID=A0A557SRQ2_9ARCH|nr:hypothetical protein [Candidatus Nitrosocosmicus arcticus]TVP39278.1 hypothetical protein NARC_170018 [Candidatus Nitrosocosmicus arcticus]
MTKSRFVRESVIKGYLNGKSFAEISNENNIAKGSVFNIINTWTAQIGIPDIDVLREFSTMIRKSGITIKQCAQSFRFIQILGSFGIRDELHSSYVADIIPTNRGENEDDPEIKNKKSDGWKKDHSPTARDNFYYFIESIYNNCKNQGIKSTNVIRWIQDLIDFGLLLYENAGNNTTGFERDSNEPRELQNLRTNNKPIFRNSKDTRNEREIQIPFISNISSYIEQKKSEVLNLDINNKKLQQEIRDLEEQKNTLLSNITNLKRKESLSLTYLDWFNSLRKELWEIYSIKLEEEFSNFVKVFNDFKYYDYDAHQIVKEYKQLESLRYEMKAIQGIVDSIVHTRDNLLKEIESLEEREGYSRQSLGALQELNYAGYGLKELKQLKNTIIEIAVSNGIEFHDAGKKFLKDVENQYDSKLGFEAKIKEVKTELKKLEDEGPAYKEYLQSKDIISRSLPYLYKFGVTDDDIISMTDVVTAYLNGNITFDPNLKSENIVDENKLIKIPYYWKSFIDELRNLGNLNSEITRQRSYLDAIRKEIDDLNSQRQKLNEQTLLSGQLLNSLHGRFPYFIESLRQIMFSVKELNKIFIVYQPLFFIHVTTSSDSKDDDNIHKESKSL